MILGKFSKISPLHQLLPLSDNERERGFIKETSKQCQKGDVVIYYIYVGKLIYGFVSLSVSKVNDIPTIQIEYLFVRKESRKKTFEDLDNKKISEFLLYYSYDLGLDLKEKVGMRWLALVPDNTKLEKYYIEKYNFTKFARTHYLFLSLKKS